MSREIKLRAYWKGVNQMVYFGEPTLDYNIDRNVGIFMKSLTGSIYMGNTEPEQSTGIIDKNGNEIYEGDIVRIWLDGWGKSKDEYRGTIIFKNGSFVIDNPVDTVYKESKCQYRPHNIIELSSSVLYEVLNKNYIPNYGEVYNLSENAIYCEVIGNIHESPEMVDKAIVDSVVINKSEPK